MDSKRQRRYTIARPESALKMLTENNDALQEEDQQFDRISDILSNLIQEANQAVSIPLTPPRLANTLFISSKKKSSKRPISYPSKRSLTPVPSLPSTVMTTKRHHVTQRNNTTPVLLESFKRLDSSMAILDSLSKDLIVPAANSVKKQRKKHHHLTFDTRLSTLILLPLFHVPHVLISMVFDTISSYDTLMPAASSATSSQSNSFSGMLIWAFIFAVTNVIMAENALPSAPMPTSAHQVIPGAYNVKRRRRSSSKRSDSPSTQFYLQRHDRSMCTLHGSSPTNSAILTGNKFRLSSTVHARRNSF
ncbi:2-isopropylmalate synthase (Alpha-isopropylmalate synthase) (Alpha-IPM synthetase) [Mucor velutinosus]|uniref:2-isopropylmalate synthase (Alpha-isopropylmalate synthase) (Alpha-IPM synthetase) n=1 Tax=Mucor velutinosus TaxID=708070 RepID=A0AAN7HK83_9FUNG|nr:2-isopropylmalate synthase (Alpha-isopropylmalate synthase) (Alpha-IPM synthetase) [Mucor velutinosus]